MNIEQINKKMVNPRHLEMIEEILTEIKEGRVCALALVFVGTDAGSGNMFHGEHPITLVGELECLKREILDNVDTRLHDAGKEY